MERKDIDFIARHYRRGLFSVNDGWQRLGIKQSPPWFRPIRVAAAFAVLVVLSATAALVYYDYKVKANDSVELTTQTPSVLEQVKVIDFEYASLADVVEKIESVYGVNVENLPEESETYELSLHYEGTPTDLISVINDILGTNMTVVKK